MIIKFRLGSWRFTFSMAPVVDIIGVNSKLPDGNHILMWDFDDVSFRKVRKALEEIAWSWKLPRIYILETFPERNFIAYCFARGSWQNVVQIIASTDGIDPNFFKYGVYRERFTLRVSRKCGRIPRLVHIIESEVPEDVQIPDLMSWVKYETLPDNYLSKIFSWERQE